MEILFEDLREVIDYNETILELWMEEYYFRHIGWQEGTQYSISLYDCIQCCF